MSTGKKSKLTRVFLFNLIAGTTLSFVLLGSMWIAWEYERFSKESDDLRAELLAAQQARLKSEIDNVIEFIEFKKSQTEVRLKREIRNRTYEAWQIAINIYDQNRDSKTSDEIKTMVKDSLRPIRFNNGRGYFFAVSMDGEEQLYPVLPELEGQNLIDLQDSKGTYVIRHEIDIVRRSNEGFVTDYWPKPNENPADVFPKISFVKYVAPLDWYVGTGEYLDNVEKDIQREVLDWIANIRVGQNDYVFAGQWDGLSLSGPAVGKNMIDVADDNGVKIVQELIAAARAGGGFVHYVMPRLDGQPNAPKISYAASIPDWQWYVGAGVYVDEIDRFIADQQSILKKRAKGEIVKIGLALICLLVVVSLAARFLSSKIEKSLRALTVFFEKAAVTATRIDPEKLTFSEFASLAEAANTMVDNRLKAERALRESREQWRAIVDNANLGIYQVTTEGRFTLVNPRMAEMLGYGSPQELIEQVPDVIQLYVNPADRQQNLIDLTSQGQITDRKVQFRCKDGKVIWIQASAQMKKEAAGKQIIEGFILDITERVEFENALKESEERYRSLVEMSPEAVLLHQEGKIEYINRQGARILGATDPGQIIGKPVLEIIHPDFRAIVQQRLSDLYQGKQQLPRMEQKYIRLDGETIDVEATGNYIVYAGKTAGLSVIRDITAAKRAERQKKKLESKLQQAQKMEAVGTLAGGIAHDFNNLLMGIQGHTSLMSHDIDTDPSQQEHLNEIESYVRSATNLTKQLLGFARGGKYEVSPTDMNDVVQRTSDMFGRTRKEITIRRKEQQDLWTTQVDRAQIEQVLLNLYVNAGQAMAGPGQLFLETGNTLLDEAFVKPYEVKPGRYVKIAITDTGHGMDEKTQKRIFDPFFTTKELGRGTGLGLASAYGIIKNHGGFITVSSETGAGATFTIYLSASDKKIPEEQETVWEIAEGSGTVLLIDDEQMILNLGRAMLTRLGYQVLTAENGHRGLEVHEVHHDTIDLVILDMIMPDMGGGEVYDRLRAIEPDVKVLLSSGYSLDGQAEKILQRGCNGFVQKPFDLVELSHKIHRILGETNPTP